MFFSSYHIFVQWMNDELLVRDVHELLDGVKCSTTKPSPTVAYLGLLQYTFIFMYIPIPIKSSHWFIGRKNELKNETDTRQPFLHHAVTKSEKILNFITSRHWFGQRYTNGASQRHVTSMVRYNITSLVRHNITSLVRHVSCPSNATSLVCHSHVVASHIVGDLWIDSVIRYGPTQRCVIAPTQR